MKERGLKELILFDHVSGDPDIQRAAALFACYQGNDGEDGSVGAADYYALQRSLLRLIGREEVAASYWQNHVCALIGAADNAFSRLAERDGFAAFPLTEGGAEAGETQNPAQDPATRAIFLLAVEELRVIRRIYQFDFEKLAETIAAYSDMVSGAENIAVLQARPAGPSRRGLIHEALTAESDWDMTVQLAAYYRNHGVGIFEGYDAFLWDGAFRGVTDADPITMDDLVGYERQKAQLIENTEFLMNGYHANNVLLYGDSGTGKSSAIKALLNLYRNRGLKLISVPKDRIGSLSEIIEYTATRGLKYIIFIDDLSFEENEDSYKKFKSAIEGNVSARADNTIICVTSNRRNIVKEVWKDRENQDDIHLRDNLQEKRSLSDRFGLTIVYSQPDKKEYLQIVTALAEKEGLNMPPQKLTEMSLTWEVRHGGRSGRTARQFIDHMIGLSKLEVHKREVEIQ